MAIRAGGVRAAVAALGLYTGLPAVVAEAAAISATSQPTDADGVVRRAQAAAGWVARSATLTRVEGSESESDVPPVQFQSTVRAYRSGDGKVHVVEDSTYRRGADGRPQHGVREFILAGQQHALYNPDVRRLQLARSPENVEKWDKIDRCSERHGDFLNGSANFGEAGNTSVFDLARAGKTSLRPSTEDVDAVPCYVLDSEVPSGKLTLWVAPSQGYNLAKYAYEQRAAPGKTFRTFSVSFDHARYRQVGGQVVVVGGELRCSETPIDGPTDDERVSAERTSIDLAPRFDDPTIFSIAGIPNGTQVVVEEERRSGLKYVWQDGKAVPYQDEQTLSSIRDEMAQVRRESAAHPASGGSADAGHSASDVTAPAPWLSPAGVVLTAGIVLAAAAAGGLALVLHSRKSHG